MSENNTTRSYHGTELMEYDYIIMMELEGLLGGKKIPIVDKIGVVTFGFIMKDNNVIGLYLSRNKLTTLPESIGNLSSLKELNLENNNLITLPESIGNLSSLKELNLENNNLRILPESIGNLSSLEKLNLDGNILLTLPESIGNLSSLEKLTLYHNHITSLPESIGNLSSLKELRLHYNQLSTLPESVTKLTLLEILILFENKLSTLPESIGDLESLKELDLNTNQLLILPESITKLTSLEKLDLGSNSLTTLPESIGNLRSLKKLNLYKNKITTLPESIGNLRSLERLKLVNNKLLTLPESIGNLRSIKELELDYNPFVLEEEKKIVKNAPSTILKYCRQKTKISLFLSHAVTDRDYFEIKKISGYLEENDEIYEVFFCEEDLKDDIDTFIIQTVPKCQLLLFFASHKSVFDSVDCRHELNLAKSHEIPIIPIKGGDVKWEKLKELGLNRTLGITFDESDFKGFCEKLYEYIKQFKHDINLFDKEEVKLDQEKYNVKITFDNFLDSEEFKEQLKTHLEEFQVLFQQLTSDEIRLYEYFIKSVQILSKTKKNEQNTSEK